jgi:predicted small metal-binding protein
MADEQARLRCACGWETAGTEEEVVAAATEHGAKVHNMRATREEVLAMIVREPRGRVSR